jgi:stage V sporulation protein S
MNRFFSKLDLRDIKIDPEGSRFPPGEDETDAEVDAVSTVSSATVTVGNDTFRPTGSPDESVVPASLNGHSSSEELAANYGPDPGDEVLKVSARSRPSAVAGAIAGVVRECGRAEVQAIGAGATNQAVKAAAIARDYLHESGIDAICIPAFIDVTIENEERTAIRIVIEPR